MPVHLEVLEAARRLCRERGGWAFDLQEVVRALPHLNENSVRTHVVSRCCVNAPKNHPHKWGYFRRIGRGRYEIVPHYRREASSPSPRAEPAGAVPARRGRVSERKAVYPQVRAVDRRDTVHAVVSEEGGTYVAECLEVAVVTQGRTLDEVLVNLRDAIVLHLEGEDLTDLGLAGVARVVVTHEVPLARNVPST